MSNNSMFIKGSLLVVILLGFALTFYTNYRAAILSITHDEGVIYRIISENSLGAIFNYIIPQDHMINSFLMKVSCMVFRDNEYVVRLPNLLGHLLYIIFSIMLLLKMKNPAVLVPGFILLNFNPYLLDFFSVARGYGLSVSFMMVSLYFIFSFIQSRKKLHLICSVFFGIVSVLTVYTLLNYLLAILLLLGIILLIWLAEKKFRFTKNEWKTYGWYTLVVVSGIALLYLQLREPLARVKSENFIYEEVQSNFYTGTLRPIAFRSIYNQPSEITVTLISQGVIFFWAISFLWMMALMIRKNFSFTRRLIFVAFCLMSFIALSLYFQNEWMDIRYLSNRTATFIAPLMVLILIGLADEMTLTRYFRIPGLIMVYLVAAFFFINTVRHANFKSYLEWQYDSTTRTMMDDLCNDVDPNPGNKVKLGIYWLHEPTVNFYKKTWKLDWLNSVDRKGYVGEFDYFYVQDADSVLSKEIFRDKIKIKSYKDSGMILLKKSATNEGSAK